MIEKIIGFVIGVLVLFWFLFIQGCDSTRISEQVLYENGTPVVGCKVHMFTDTNYNGYTITDENGEWSLIVPEDSEIKLCISNPLNDNEMSCYEGQLTTPTIESNEHKIKEIE